MLLLGGKPLHISKGLLAKLKGVSDAVASPAVDDATGSGALLPFSAEEQELAKRLYDDFSRFPAADELTPEFPEGSLVSRAALAQHAGTYLIATIP